MMTMTAKKKKNTVLVHSGDGNYSAVYPVWLSAGRG